MMTNPIIIGAEPYEFKGKNVGIFMIHDFAGSTIHLKRIAEGFAQSGYSVKLPTLLGHGTAPDELLAASYEELFEAIESEFKAFYEQMEYTIVLGFATGGALAQQLAQKHDISGLILINSFFAAPEKFLEDALLALDAHESYIETGTIDIKNERATVSVYNKFPAQLIAQLQQVSTQLQQDASKIQAPILILQSIDDHVYSPVNADRILSAVGSREKHLVMLQDSYHFAPVDYDQERITNQSIFFVKGLDPRRED